MANIYVRSTDGSDSDNGSTWALAKAGVKPAGDIDAAGDNIYVSQSHSETVTSLQLPAWAGTVASPTKLICVNDGAEPPTAVADTALVRSTGNTALYVGLSGALYVYGMSYKSGDGASGAAQIAIAYPSEPCVLEKCSFNTASTDGTNSNISANGANGRRVRVVNCTFKFGAAGQALLCEAATLEMVGGSLLSGGTSPDVFLKFANLSRVLISGFDFSNGDSDINLCTPNGAAGHGARITFRNCKLPTSWSGSVCSGTVPSDARVSMYNCDAGDTNYRLGISDWLGTIASETTLVRTGGASNGVTTLSWKMVSNTLPVYPMWCLYSDEIVKWNETVGSSVTATVEILHDSATNLTDAEVWLEVLYLGTDGVPLGGWITDAKADILASAADQTDSSETWTTTGMSNPNTQKLSVSFTPREKGYIHARVALAKASATVYVDPLLTVA